MTTHRPHRLLRSRLAVGVLALALGLAACGGDGGGGDDDSSAAATADEVVMKLVAFQPELLEVAAGTTVTWQQRDPGAHTVTSGTVEQGAAAVTAQPDDVFDSGRLSTGDTFEHTFDEPGSYLYFCALHPATMRGEIRVS